MAPAQHASAPPALPVAQGQPPPVGFLSGPTPGPLECPSPRPGRGRWKRRELLGSWNERWLRRWPTRAPRPARGWGPRRGALWPWGRPFRRATPATPQEQHHERQERGEGKPQRPERRRRKCAEEGVKGAARVSGAVLGSVRNNTEAGPKAPRESPEDQQQEGHANHFSGKAYPCPAHGGNPLRSFVPWSLRCLLLPTGPRRPWQWLLRRRLLRRRRELVCSDNSPAQPEGREVSFHVLIGTEHLWPTQLLGYIILMGDGKAGKG